MIEATFTVTVCIDADDYRARLRSDVDVPTDAQLIDLAKGYLESAHGPMESVISATLVI